MASFVIFFFFQAEDGIRDHCVTGVQTCALPIWMDTFLRSTQGRDHANGRNPSSMLQTLAVPAGRTPSAVSEPTSPLTTLPIVPSPPTANTASLFSVAACFASSTICSPLLVSAASTFHPADSSSSTADLINGLTENRPAVGL